MTTKGTRSRAGWSAGVVAAPLIAALAAGSVVWAADHDPLAATAAPQTSSVQVATVAEAGPPEPALQANEPSLKELRGRLARLERKIAKARKEIRQAKQGSVVNAGSSGSTWSGSGSSGSGSSGSGSSGSGSSGSGSSGGGQAQPAPAPAPAPPPADTWTGSSGG